VRSVVLADHAARGVGADPQASAGPRATPLAAVARSPTETLAQGHAGEHHVTNLRHRRGLMKVEEILKSKGRSVVTIQPWVSVAEAVRRLNGPPQIGALVVCADAERREIAGTITERDIIRGLDKHGPELLAMQVSDVMSRGVPVCSREDSIARLMQKMTTSRYRHLPVVEDGRLVGLVSIGDVVKGRLADMELETGLLRDLYIARG